MPLRDDLPPRFRSAMERPATERQPWSKTLAGALIASYLWVAYSDQLAPTTLAVGGLPAAIGGAAVGGLLACVLLFFPAGLQGVRTRMPMMVVASSAFGLRGAALVPGLLVGMVQILWFAVAVHFAVAYNLAGLSAAGLIEPEALRPAEDGGAITGTTVYAASALLWGIAAALVATRFIRWIAALMVVYPAFLALAIGGAMTWAMPGLPAFQATAADATLSPGLAAWPAFGAMTQLVFGFSATIGIQSINWGATLRGPRDVVYAGVVGVGLAATIVAAVAVLTVAGSIGRELEPALTAEEPGGAVPPVEGADAPFRVARPPLPTDPTAYTLEAVFARRIGGVVGGVALIVLGLGSMASAVYASFAYSNRLEAIRARPRRWAWGVIGAVVAFPLMVNGLAGNVPLVIDLTAGVLAPVLGVLAAELVLHRSAWPGPRPGVRPIGLASWGAGAALGLLPIVARVVPGLDACRWLPMAVLGYMLAFAVAVAADRGASARRAAARRPSSG